MVHLAHNASPQPKRHLDRFSRICRAQDCHRPTDRQTDHATPSVTMGHIYVVLRCGLIIMHAIGGHTSLVQADIIWRAALFATRRYMTIRSITSDERSQSANHQLHGLPMGGDLPRRQLIELIGRTCFVDKLVNDSLTGTANKSVKPTTYGVTGSATKSVSEV